LPEPSKLDHSIPDDQISPTLCAFQDKVGHEEHSQRRPNILSQLHQNATTTPKVCAPSQASDDCGAALAERFGVTALRLHKWRWNDSGKKPQPTATRQYP